MIINNQYRFIYIHVPKTAGTACSTFLSRYAGPADIDLGGAIPDEDWGETQSFPTRVNTIWREQWGLEKHSRVMRIRKRLGPQIWTSYFKFAFVRNPFARTYSGFRFAQRGQKLGSVLQGMSFSDFLQTEMFQDLRVLPIQSQAAFLHPIGQVDFIGRQENLTEDLKMAASIIEQRQVESVDIPDLNRSAKPDEWRSMSEADKDIIRKVLARPLPRPPGSGPGGGDGWAKYPLHKTPWVRIPKRTG